MKILALDCAGAAISCAVTDDEKLLGETVLQSEKKHSVTLLPAVNSLMSNCNITADDIDIYGVTVGPGSFTGVRIGVSLIKGLAFGKNKPCVAVSTMDALAYNLDGFEGIVCPVMDARRSQFYNALYRNGVRLCEDRLISYVELSEELTEYGEKTYFIGDGAYLAKQLIDYENSEVAPNRLVITSGYSTAVCALRNYNSNIGVYSDIELSPLYLRLSQAEREREEKIIQKNKKEG